MSMSGPCAWLSTLPPPVTSHLPSANYWSKNPWNGEQVSPRPRVLSPHLLGTKEKEAESVKPPATEMQPAMVKAETGFLTTTTAGPSTQTPYPEHVTNSNNLQARNAVTEGESSVSQPTRLEKADIDRAIHPSSSVETNAGAPRERIPEVQNRDQEDVDMEKDDGEAASSDDGAGSSGERKRSIDAKAEKKKMKRFRLTHNQTRFLMSEFTRQAHPDAAHRERLSKEIPGLTPRQVQVWFQNRRAKLKRLTSNDRERMLKSRALPDDFDTTQVLRTPFEGKSSSEASMLLTDGAQRLNDDEYVVSPLSSTSVGGNSFPAAGPDRNIESYPHSAVSGRPVPGPLSDLQRHSRGAFSFPPRSSSFSETSFNSGLQFPGRFPRPGLDSLGHPGMQYTRRAMEYGINRPASSMLVGYEGQRPLEGSVSPTGPSEQQLQYNTNAQNQQLHNYQHPLGIPTSVQPHARQIPSLQSIPVTDAPEYRPYSYEHHPYGVNTNLPYAQANASSMSLPASFPSDSGSVATTSNSTEERMGQNPQMLDPLRAKFGQQTFDYANYL